jgi:two-component system, OmpR family, phosphate regulon response regulator PhoB
MGGQILVVHRDGDVRTRIRTTLERGGFDVDEAVSFDGTFERLETLAPGLVLIPWSSETETRETLARLKASSVTGRRVIVLAPGSQMGAAIGALACGADDCIAAPFVAEELIARVTACMRRSPAAVSLEHLSAGPVVLDKGAHILWVRAERVELAPTEFRLLSFFLENQGRVFSRSELLKGAWARHVEAGPRTVDVHVRRLRQVLEPFGCDDMLQTVRGFGYRFAAGASNERATRVRGMAKLARSH